ncbi:MAG: YCF48-related protein [Acidobacteriota bacterium]|nr:YCF48-related protein [Acidobacteriota bacterium]
MKRKEVFALKKIILLVFTALLTAQNFYAQTGWSVNRAKGAGDLVTVYFTSSKDGWAAGDKGYLAYTKDGGVSWTTQNLNTDENINEIYFRNDNNGYLVAGKKMFITKDGGRTWQEIKIYKTGDFKNLTPEFLSIRFPDKKLGFVIGSLLNKNDEVVDSLVMRTNDGGETWSRSTISQKVELYHLDFVNSSYGWIVGDKGMILMTYDGGLTWIKQKSGTDKALYNVDFRDESEGYAVGGKGTILRTEDGGQTWETVKTNFPSTFLRVDFADSKNGWIVGYNGTILRSSDKGKTWEKQTSDTKENLYGLFMTKKYGWTVGANGVILKYQK